MQRIFTMICVIALMSLNGASAQSGSNNIAMNTFMAKPGNSASPANVSMWPNPASGSVNVYINSIREGDRGQVVLYNAAGKPCIISNLQNGNNKVFFNALPAGMYYASIKLKNNIVFSKKLIVTKQF
ncbi:T9SS type A sorting domain-containing protein [Panacibacter sp. DH6]|uniref:T9SS type A sorting domain-containing protein n=1 Tax=Panacibacter microcysteis TaxID=2793269 RepID=A0A931H070_9BACT|nr:T9SS type A sorting domain-containing protein [Panacibacter microcysteis]MBG9378611.1 T9SS type A sorting domain-containing protein [Panacibacter microcysteis]